MPNGTVLYDGPSQLDGRTRVVAIYLPASKNRKTGAMAQTYILCAAIEPYAALAQRLDGAICGGCPLRPQWTDGAIYTGRACYVDIRIVGGIWRAWHRGKYPHARTLDLLGAEQVIRLGAYGDPAAVPLDIWNALLSRSAGHTGYTHQWRAKRFAGLARWCQASCESYEDVADARALGWRTFHVVGAHVKVHPALVCPASKEGQHRETCATCRKCDGRTADVQIRAHGFGAQFVTLRRAGPPTWRKHYGQGDLFHG